MAASDFVHGVETFTAVIGGKSITIVRTAVVMLIGLAPKGPSQELTLVQKQDDLSQWGSYLAGFTIPQALNIIFEQSSKATVVVVNIYDPETHDIEVEDEPHVMVGGKTKLTYEPTSFTSLTNAAGDVTYVLDTDYSVDDYGNIKVIGTTISQTGSVKANYNKLDTTTITSAQIIGAVTGDVRTGMKLFDLSRVQFGFTGKILICPVYGALTAVSAGMVAYINDKRACTFTPAPFGTSKATAVAGRGAGGSINFQTQNKRVMLLFPWVKDNNLVTDADQYSDPSAYYAGQMCATDALEGPQTSVSNHEIIGVNGTEIPITDEISDPNSDANALNGAGISTVSMGSGVARTWGNRNASFPENTAIDSFLSVIRVSDIIAESIEYYSRPYIDKPITKAIIDQIRADVNAFMRILISRGWILDGSKCTWDKAKNPNEELALGHLVFDYNFLPPPPMERLTYNAFVDINLFTKALAA